MKQRIILISGLAGSGKTTIGEILHEKLESCARIESDFLILVKPFIKGKDLSDLKIKNTSDIAHNFLKKGYRNLLVIGAVWNQEELDKFSLNFSGSEYDIYFFWLNVSKKIRFERASQRQDPGDDAESLEKIESIHGAIGFPLNISNGKYYKINIDNETLPEKVANEILSIIEK